MKFWKILSYLIEQTLPEWQDKFLSYKDLKKQLRLIYPKEAEAGPSYRPSKRPRVAEEGGGGDSPAAADGMEKEVSDFVMLLEDEIDKFNAFFVDKEEGYIIRLKVLKDCVANVEDLNEELMTIVREIVDFHGEMVLLLNYSALNYTGLVKIIKKYDKRSGALIRLPFIQKVLQQPFFKTDILNKLVKECGAMLDQFFSSKRLATCQAAETKEELDPEIEDKPQKVTDELAEIINIENMYLKQTLAALEVLNKIRSGSSTVSEFSLPPMHRNDREEA